MPENCNKMMHFGFNFDACPMQSPYRFVHLTHQNLSARALFCHNSLAKGKYTVSKLQIMNVYECNGTNIFISLKMKCSIQQGKAE